MLPIPIVISSVICFQRMEILSLRNPDQAPRCTYFAQRSAPTLSDALERLTELELFLRQCRLLT